MGLFNQKGLFYIQFISIFNFFLIIFTISGLFISQDVASFAGSSQKLHIGHLIKEVSPKAKDVRNLFQDVSYLLTFKNFVISYKSEYYYYLFFILLFYFISLKFIF